MGLDKAAPVYTGKDESIRRIAEYENYLREQTAHELEIMTRKSEDLGKKIEALEKRLAEIDK